MHNLAPFDHRHVLWVAGNFCELVCHDPGLSQTVKIKMSNRKRWADILAAYGKSWARHFVLAARAARKTTRKRCFATAQVTDKFNNFAATQFSPDGFGELLGLFGTCG